MKNKGVLVVTMAALIIGFAITFIGVGSVSMGGGISLVVLAFTAFVFYFIYKFLIGPALNAVRLRKNGIPGHARILSIKDTGMIINDSLVKKLEVEVKNSFGQKYIASVNSIVPRNNPNLYQIGMELAVKIDPNKQENLIIDDAPVSSGPMAIPVTGPEMAKEVKDTIFRTGRPAKAIVKRYNWLGSYENSNDPLVELELEVIPGQYPRFEGKARGVIPEALIHKYQPGCEINVKLDLYDNNNIILDLN